jgi:hypothetical protein
MRSDAKKAIKQLTQLLQVKHELDSSVSAKIVSKENLLVVRIANAEAVNLIRTQARYLTRATSTFILNKVESTALQLVQCALAEIHTRHGQTKCTLASHILTARLGVPEPDYCEPFVQPARDVSSADFIREKREILQQASALMRNGRQYLPSGFSLGRNYVYLHLICDSFLRKGESALDSLRDLATQYSAKRSRKNALLVIDAEIRYHRARADSAASADPVREALSLLLK